MKHAYLILAHGSFDLLRLLISRLDDVRNDIFVHLDKKVKILPEVHAEHAGLYFTEERVDVRWGDWTVVEAEYVLFAAAVARGPYQYYHLLSGVDLPVKSQDYIHVFCDTHQGTEFIGYTLTEITPEVLRKVQRWHLFPKDFKNSSIVKRALRAAYIRVQEILGIYRNRDVDFKKGSQWVSVTDAMARHFLAHRAWAQKVFSHSFCADEMVMQTLAWQAPFRKKLYNTQDDGAGCLRAIGWKDGQIVDWTPEDLPSLRASEALFARKFRNEDVAEL